MANAEPSRKGKVLRAYTKPHDVERNSATVLVITRTFLQCARTHGVIIYTHETIHRAGPVYSHFTQP